MSFLLRVAAVASVLGMALAAPALAAEMGRSTVWRFRSTRMILLS